MYSPAPTNRRRRRSPEQGICFQRCGARAWSTPAQRALCTCSTALHNSFNQVRSGRRFGPSGRTQSALQTRRATSRPFRKRWLPPHSSISNSLTTRTPHRSASARKPSCTADPSISARSDRHSRRSEIRSSWQATPRWQRSMSTRIRRAKSSMFSMRMGLSRRTRSTI